MKKAVEIHSKTSSSNTEKAVEELTAKNGARECLGLSKKN